MSDKKRKGAFKDVERPKKKQQALPSVRVQHLTSPDVAKPVIVSSPGTSLPDVKFQPYSNSTGRKKQLLLHSSDHSSLDYTAREDENSIENHLKHYVAVFDPETGSLQVAEAKRLTVRSVLRSTIVNQEENEDNNQGTSNYSSRAALTAAFGTKKSKKAVQSINENRLSSQTNGDAEDPISSAILSNIKEDDEIDNELSLTDVLENKPLPPADLTTDEIDKVYSVDAIVQPSPAATTLAMMPIDPWKARISAGKEVQARTRFVAHRVGYLITHLLQQTPSNSSSSSELTTTIQLLRYIQLLLDIYLYISRLPKFKPIPPPNKWPETAFSECTPMSIVRPVVSHFFPDHKPTTHAVTLLRTTILALTLHIPPPSMNRVTKGQLISEPTDISLDMALETAEVRKLYRELGCKLSPATESELSLWGLERLAKQQKKKGEKGAAAQPKPVFARLSFPLDFPKVSKGRPSARR